MTKRISGTSGVDIFVAAKLGESLPATVGLFTLKSVSSRGTVTSATSAEEILDVGWVCARYLLNDKTMGSEAFNAEVSRLIGELGKSREWSSIIKLYDVDGDKAYSG